MPWELDGCDDVGGFGGDLGLGGDGDLHALERVDDALDGHAGGVLQVPGDGQGGHDRGQVDLDGITLVVEDRAGPQRQAHPLQVGGHRFVVEAELLGDLLDHTAAAMQLDHLIDDLSPQAAVDAPRGGSRGLVCAV